MSPEKRTHHIEMLREEILKQYPFFGPDSLCVDSMLIERKPNGEIGTRGIGQWTIPERISSDHFADFQTERGTKVNGLKIVPGHFLIESLGQALGLVVAARYPDCLKDTLPVFDGIDTMVYFQGAFTGETVNLCVELLDINPILVKDKLTTFVEKGLWS